MLVLYQSNCAQMALEKAIPFSRHENEDCSPESSGLRSEDVVGRTFSLAERETKKANGTSHRNRVKYVIT